MALIDILRDGVTQIDYVVEITYRNPATDTVTTIYLSRHGTVPGTGPSDTPPNESFPGRVLSLGPLSETLDNDLNLSGPARYEIGNVKIDNTPTSPTSGGPYDAWASYSFAGRKMVIWAGAQGAAFSTYEIIRTATVRGEPLFVGTEIDFGLQSTLSRLDIPLIVNRYTGNPSSVRMKNSSTIATAPHTAAYDLSSFTIAISFRTSTAPSSGNIVYLMSKALSGTNNNWIMYIDNTVLSVSLSVGGVSTVVASPSISGYVDGKWHTVALAAKSSETVYCMIDGVLIATLAISGIPDRPTTDLNYGLRSSFTQNVDIQDGIIFNTYLTPDEARSLISTRLIGDETGLVALHRFDDGGGAAVSDYSLTNNDATLLGTSPTDYEWISSGRGMPEQAGSPMPIIYGDVFNAPLDLIDSSLEHHRWHDGESSAISTYNTTLTVKSQGVPLTPVTDWNFVTNSSSGEISTTDEIGQPATFDTSNDIPGSYPNAVIEHLMTERGGFNNAADINLNWLDAISRLMPVKTSVYIGEDAGLGDKLGSYVSGLGAHVRLERETDKFIFSQVLPAIGPGPYASDEPVLEFIGGPTDAVNFGDIANPTSSMSVACWFRSLRGLQVPASGYSNTALVSKDSGSGGYYLQQTSTGGIEFFIRNLGSLGTDHFVVKPGRWYFVMGTFDDAADTMKIFLGELGGSLIEISSRTLVGSPTTTAVDLTVGGNGSYVMIGGICHVHVWSKSHTLAQAQSLMNTPPVGNEASLLFYAPMNDGVDSGLVVNQLVGSTTGTIEGLCRWSPQLTIDLTISDNGDITSFGQVIPAGDIDVEYAINYSPMSQSDIPSVSDEDALELKLPSKHLRLIRQSVKDDYEQTRTISVTSPLTERIAAAYLVNLLGNRFNPGRLTADVSDIHRDAMLLNLTDEVRVKSYQYGLSSGVHFRVASKTNDLSTLMTSLKLALGRY